MFLYGVQVGTELHISVQIVDTAMTTKDKNYLKIDFDYMPARAHVYNEGVLVKKWSAKKPVDLIHQVIDGLDDTVFVKIRMKKTLNICLGIFDPKSIKIIEKG